MLSKTPGVLAVEGALKTKEVTIIRHEGTVNDEELVERLSQIGHTVVRSTTEGGGTR